MAMAQYESSVRYIPFSQEVVYNKLSDLNNLAPVKDRMDLLREKTDGKLEDIDFDQDTVTVRIQGMNLTMRIIEREPMKCIKFEDVQSPIPMNLWIQILPVDEEQSKIKLTIRAELNFFMKQMVEKPLKQGVEKLSEMLSLIPYNYQ